MVSTYQKKKKEKSQINRNRNEKEVTTDTTEIQRIMRDYYKQQFANKMDNLEEMDKFLEEHNLPRLNQEEIENINEPNTSIEIDTVIKNLPTNKSTNQMASQANSIKHWRRANIYPSQTLPKYSRGRNTPKLILRGHHHPYSKPDKDVTEK